MNYKLVHGPDNTVWVSLQPLEIDVRNSLKKLEDIDTTDLSKLDRDIIEFNILGMKAINTFLLALIDEAKNEKL